MLVLHLGKPGSGKTYEAVAFEVLPALRQGRKVVTNVPLNVEKLAEEVEGAWELVTVVKRGVGAHRPFSVLADYEEHDKWRHPNGSGMGPLFVIDEASQALPGAGRGTVPEDVKFWYEEHRKVGAKIVLITQQVDYIVKSIRELAEFSYSFKKMSALGLGGYWKRHYSGTLKSSGSPDRTQWRWYQRRFFGFYNSFNKGQGGGPVKESVQPLWRRPSMYVGFAAIAFWMSTCAGFNTISIPGASDGDSGQVDRREVVRSEPVQTVQTVQAQPVAPGDRHPLHGQLATLAVLSVGGDTSYLLRIGGQRWSIASLRHLGYDVVEVGGGDLVIRWPGHAWPLSYVSPVVLH